jgi:23S rRNA A1618 N6-methylase RlmF
MELRCRQQRRLEKASQSEREGRHHRTQTRDNQNGPSSKSTNSSTFSAQITHAFNASLTRALLHHHFQLEIPSLPAGRLCPPIPNRANYVCWLKELLSQSRKDLYRFSDAASITDADDGGVTWQCRGMDIGTGVSAIYPLLLTTNLFFIPPNSGVMDKFERSSKQWEFLATDIDPLAIESARINIRTNRLEDKIHLVQVDDADSTMTAKQIKRGPLFAAMEASKHTALRPRCLEDHSGMNSKELAEYPKFDFVMTNPPFYKTLKEATSPRAGDKRSRTDMSDKESVYTRATCDFGVDMDDDEDCNAGGGGGDVDFVTAIMNDSQFFRHHVTWYTSLVCKKSSLDAIQQKLQTLDGVWGNRGQVRMVEFRQDNLDGSEIVERSHIGSPRVRWGIGWTYERAMIRCSACRVREGLQSFEVWVSVGDADDKARRASDEVASRLITYFENTQNVTWKCSQQMREYINDVLPSGSNDGSGRQSYQDKLMKCVTVVEERFYNPTVPSQEYDNINLPVDGHALIDAFLESSGKYNASGCVSVQVILDMYSHTKHGSAIINMLQCQLPGEIGRTNRKWRRLLQRQTTT